MKRSEAVNVILHRLYGAMDSKYWKDAPEYASEILSDLESEGMIPPAKRLDIASGKIIHYEVPDSIEKTGKLSEVGELTDWIIEDTTVLWEDEDV